MMNRTKRIVPALMLLAIPLLSALLAYSVLTSTARAQNPDCPLSDGQAQKSVEAFAKIANVFTKEPRCVNCHGAVDPFGADANRTHGGGKLDPIMKTEPSVDTGELETTRDIGATLGQCQDCHSAFPGFWAIPPPSQLFVGKDAFTLCVQMRDQFEDASAFINHIEHDVNPDDPFIQEAFTGRMGLDDFGRTLLRPPYVFARRSIPYPAPPIGVTHQDLIRMVHDWVDAQGGRYQGDSECGCKPLRSPLGVWEGEIIAKRVHLSADGVGNWIAKYLVRLQEECPEYSIAKVCSENPSEYCGVCFLKPLELKYEVEANEVLDKHYFGIYPPGDHDFENISRNPRVPHNRSVTGKASGVLGLGENLIGKLMDEFRFSAYVNAALYKDRQAPVSLPSDTPNDPRESEAERYWNSCLAGVPQVTGQPSYRIGINLESEYQDGRSYSDLEEEILNPLLKGITRSGPDLQEGKGNLHDRSDYSGPVLNFWLCGKMKSPDDTEISGEHAFSSYSNNIDQLYSGPTQVNITWKLKRK